MVELAPRYSKEYIERRAERTLEGYAPQCLRQAQPTPLGDIAARVSRDLGASFRFDQDLGLNKKGEKILGACYFDPVFAIYVDPSLQGEGQGSRFRFTFAHELGHLSLHRRLRREFESLDATAKAIVDTESDLEGGERRILETTRDFLEWQANSYAAALLMPRRTFGDELKRQQKDMGSLVELAVSFWTINRVAKATSESWCAA